MSQYTTQFENLRLSEKCETSIRVWSEDISLANLQPSQQEDYKRLLKALQFLQAYVKTIDADLYPLSVYNVWTTNIANIATYAASFKSSQNYTYIQRANSEVDSLLTHVRNFGRQITPSFTKSLSEAAQNHTDYIAGLLNELASKRLELTKRIDEFTKKISALESKANTLEQQTIPQQTQRLETAISEQQKQFSTAQEQRSKAFSESQAKHSTDFSDAQEKYANKTSASVEESKKDFVEAARKIIEDYAIIFSKAEANAENAVRTVAEIEGKVKQIFNVVGNVSISGDYKNTADNECTAANRLRKFATYLMLFMGVIAGATFFHSLWHPEVDWKLFGFRLGTTFVIAFPALYLARESAKHRKRENTNRKLHLELAAIDAYLELLPDEEKQKIKGNLTEKFFGQTEPQSKDETITQHQLFRLFSAVLKNVTKRG